MVPATDLLVLCIILVLVLGVITPISVQSAKAAKDHAVAIVGTKTYKFDWDYKRRIFVGGEGASVIKNTKSHQDTVSAKSGSIIGAKIFNCCKDGWIDVSLTKDKVKVKHATYNGFDADAIKSGLFYNAQLINDCDVALQKGCQQDWKLPNVKKGTYSLYYEISGSDAINEIYLTKIKIFK